ncbi:hypothetical protein JTB14_009634 [Gonioctena quinquepunctata]|nr:hypothetical protein JTB14_009634 [Gonioctena quinquepunctata]
MESKHVSSDIKHEVKIEVISKGDFNVRFKEEIVKEELVENEHSSEYVGDNSCPEQIRGETWCMPDLIKLEDFSSEDNREIEVPQLKVDEDKKSLKKLVEGVTGHEKHLQDCSEDPTDTAGCEDVKIEDEIDIKYEDVKTQTDEEESNEDKTGRDLHRKWKYLRDTTSNTQQEEYENLDFQTNSRSVPQLTPISTQIPSQQTIFQKRQRYQGNAKFNETITQIEKKKAKVLEEVFKKSSG